VDGITAAYQRLIGGLAVGAVGYALVQRAKNLREPLPAGLSNPTERRRERWRAAWSWVLVNGISGPALGVSCYQWALETTPTGIVLAIVATTPLVVIPFAVKFEGERPKARSVIGGAVAVLGAIGLTLVA
jgi:drug/metabolite transporter (DMT)-like permease